MTRLHFFLVPSLSLAAALRSCAAKAKLKAAGVHLLFGQDASFFSREWLLGRIKPIMSPTGFVLFRNPWLVSRVYHQDIRYPRMWDDDDEVRTQLLGDC